MKRILMSIGFLIAMLGMAGFDSNILISVIFMLVGGLMIAPYVKEFEQEEERRARHERRNKK